MSEMTKQKQVTILLAIVAVLLAAIVGIMIYQANAVPGPTVDASTSQTAQSDPAAATTPQATGVPAAAPEFDEATAPKVPAEQTPEQYVNAYYQLTMDGDFDAAFVMLPTATQASYGDSAAYAAQLQGYGITGFSVDPQVEQDGNIYVVGTTETPQMPIAYTWTFVQGADGTWLAAGREMGGM
jgi:hypothetical protein